MYESTERNGQRSVVALLLIEAKAGRFAADLW